MSESTKKAVPAGADSPIDRLLGRGFWEEALQVRVRCVPVEVGCWGFAECPLATAYRELGIEGESKRTAIHSTTEAAERASRRLWL